MTGAELATIDMADRALSLLPKGWEVAKQLLVSVTDRAKYEFRIAHSEYCTNMASRYCRAKTFFVRDQPQFLEDFYVPASIEVGKRKIERANLQEIERISRRAVISGNGGSGNTVFMRHLLLDAINKGIGYPVFIELRGLNDEEEIDLSKIVLSFMKENGFPLGEDFARTALEDGLLVILLDGFDEVVFSKRKALERAIIKLGRSTSSTIIVSSRPDMTVEAWDNFATLKMAPLGLAEAVELIEKIDFKDDDGVRAKFINRLRGGLFKKHEHFLSNPLLLSIMLLTYGDSADIPDRFASFYERAYTALFEKHDALKSGFRRERATNLDIYGFSRLFAAFSAITYDKRAFRFSKGEALGYVDQAKRVVSAQVGAEEFLDDAQRAVCLLVEDGLELSFVHRSFQEYFVAKFIVDAENELQKKFISKLSTSQKGVPLEVDNVMKILYEMAPGLVEDHFLIDGLERFFEKDAGKKLTLAAWRRLFRKLIARVHVESDSDLSFGIASGGHFAVIRFAYMHCLPPKGRVGRSKGNALLPYANAAGVIEVGAHTDRSPVWGELSEMTGMFSVDFFERLRLHLVGLKTRARERSAAIDEVFVL